MMYSTKVLHDYQQRASKNLTSCLRVISYWHIPSLVRWTPSRLYLGCFRPLCLHKNHWSSKKVISSSSMLNTSAFWLNSSTVTWLSRILHVLGNTGRKTITSGLMFQLGKAFKNYLSEAYSSRGSMFLEQRSFVPRSKIKIEGLAFPICLK